MYAPFLFFINEKKDITKKGGEGVYQTDQQNISK